MKANSIYMVAFLSSTMTTAVFSDPLTFSYAPPGELEPHSGKGVTDKYVYFDSMRFPLENKPAFLNSQKYRKGGDRAPRPGKQCAPENYSYPWRDNFCEARPWDVRLCPSGKGHQGQDIRPATCHPSMHWAVAASDGVIVHIGTYSVTLQSPKGTLYRYLHLDMKHLAVKDGDRVNRGDKIGKVSNFFNGTSTTTHLHFDIKDSVVIKGKRIITYVPPYTSLVSAYEKLLKGTP